MKKIIGSTLFLALALTGCKNASTNLETSMNNESISNEAVALEEENQVEGNNKACAWIDNSDVVIKLDLPEEYANYNDKNILPSYETGFMIKSSYGDIASIRPLAIKGCDYRVGFSKEDFAAMNLNPNYPLVILAKKDYKTDFTYDNEPMKITLKDGLPEQGNEFIIKITGERPSFGHYDAVFE